MKKMRSTVITKDPSDKRVTLVKGSVAPDWYEGKAVVSAEEPAPRRPRRKAEAQHPSDRHVLLRWADTVVHAGMYRNVDAAMKDLLTNIERGSEQIEAYADRYAPETIDLGEADREDELARAEAAQERHPDAEPVPPTIPEGDPEQEETPGASDTLDAGATPEAEPVPERTEEDQARDEAAAALISGSVKDVLERVGEDQELGRRALAAELAKGADARSTLTSALEALVTVAPAG